jgi:Outer membrane protein beta-barrel domain
MRRAIAVALFAAFAISQRQPQRRFRMVGSLTPALDQRLARWAPYRPLTGPAGTASTNTSQWRESWVCCHMLPLTRQESLHRPCPHSCRRRIFASTATTRNGNLTVQPGLRARAEPYATVGIGTFTGSTVAAADVGPTEFRQYQNDTHFASNFGAGLTYRLNRWLGLNADYRHFIVNAGDQEHLNRFATGVKVFVK